MTEIVIRVCPEELAEHLSAHARMHLCCHLCEQTLMQYSDASSVGLLTKSAIRSNIKLIRYRLTVLSRLAVQGLQTKHKVRVKSFTLVRELDTNSASSSDIVAGIDDMPLPEIWIYYHPYIVLDMLYFFLEETVKSYQIQMSSNHRGLNYGSSCVVTFKKLIEDIKLDFKQFPNSRRNQQGMFTAILMRIVVTPIPK